MFARLLLHRGVHFGDPFLVPNWQLLCGWCRLANAVPCRTLWEPHTRISPVVRGPVLFGVFLRRRLDIPGTSCVPARKVLPTGLWRSPNSMSRWDVRQRHWFVHFRVHRQLYGRDVLSRRIVGENDVYGWILLSNGSRCGSCAMRSREVRRLNRSLTPSVHRKLYSWQLLPPRVDGNGFLPVWPLLSLHEHERGAAVPRRAVWEHPWPVVCSMYRLLLRGFLLQQRLHDGYRSNMPHLKVLSIGECCTNTLPPKHIRCYHGALHTRLFRPLHHWKLLPSRFVIRNSNCVSFGKLLPSGVRHAAALPRWHVRAVDGAGDERLHWHLPHRGVLHARVYHADRVSARKLRRHDGPLAASVQRSLRCGVLLPDRIYKRDLRPVPGWSVRVPAWPLLAALFW